MRNPSDVGYADHSQARTIRCPWHTDTPMRLTCWLFGREVFALDLGPATADEPDETPTIGGDTGTTWLDPGSTDHYMGFTGGREGDGE